MAGGVAFLLAFVLIVIIGALVVYFTGLGSWIGSRRERQGRSGKERRGPTAEVDRHPEHTMVRDDGSDHGEAAAEQHDGRYDRATSAPGQRSRR